MGDFIDDIFVARQPIFDTGQNLFGYELLYRNSFTSGYEGADGTSATLDVLRNAFLLLGHQLTGSKKAFINFNRDLLEKRSALSLRPESTVIEILEDVEGDHAVLEACRELKQAGYTIALDDFTLHNDRSKPLLDLVDIVKVDFRPMSREERRAVVTSYGKKSIQFLAEKVETPEEFAEACEDGYHYFQGYFFGKPVIVSAKSIPGTKLNYLRMLSEINEKELNFAKLEKIIMQDPYFSYTLLNYMNSAYFGFRDHISSIRQALVLLGEHEVRRWASLVILTFIGADKPAEVVITSLIRAKFCELLAMEVDLEGNASELFMVGMFSMLDVLIGRPLEETLDKINLSTDIKEAICLGGNRYGDVLLLVKLYERARWEDVSKAAAKLDIGEKKVPAAYRQAVEWAEQVLQTESSKAAPNN
jgi:EAL and modified HD-GYP domain-containing signal transduction protein